MSLPDAARDLGEHGSARSGCASPPRTSGMTQNAHENEQPSWIFTKARVRSSLASRLHAADRADVAGNGSGNVLARLRDHRDVGRHVLERRAEVRGAARDVDPAVSSRGAGDGLTRLRDGLVRDAARIDDRNVTRA